MKKEIIIQPHPLLRRKSVEVSSISTTISASITDLIDTLKSSTGIGLAAPQIGLEHSIFVMYHNNRVIKPYINPIIEKSSKKTVKFNEGCLSIPGVNVTISRSAEITVSYIDMTSWNRVTEELSGLLAIVAQHEIDHLKAKLIIDYL